MAQHRKLTKAPDGRGFASTRASFTSKRSAKRSWHKKRLWGLPRVSKWDQKSVSSDTSSPNFVSSQDLAGVQVSMCPQQKFADVKHFKWWNFHPPRSLHLAASLEPRSFSDARSEGHLNWWSSTKLISAEMRGKTYSSSSCSCCPDPSVRKEKSTNWHMSISTREIMTHLQYRATSPAPSADAFRDRSPCEGCRLCLNPVHKIGTS